MSKHGYSSGDILTMSAKGTYMTVNELRQEAGMPPLPRLGETYGMKMYILDGNAQPVECDPIRAAEWKQDHFSECIVGRTVVGNVEVSTVFLGMDHSYGDGPPVLWETLVRGGSGDGDITRYDSLAEAEQGHAAICAVAEEEQK